MRVRGKVVKAPPSLAPEEQPRVEDPRVIEPTPAERRNGWTRESLNQYLQDRFEQRQTFAAKLSERDIRNARSEDTSKFDPHRWGR